MSGADEVSAVEGASAVLPCTFTHPPPDVALNGSVIWNKTEPGATKPVFKCTYPGSGPSGCDTTTQEAGGGRFGFVGNLSRRDASIMVEPLNRSDGGRYRCRVELNVNSFQTVVPTDLSVRAPNESVSVMTGTEGASATLPCVFTRPRQSLTAHTVTWMRKDPYRIIVTFRHHGNGSWVAENGVTRYELVEDLELGSAWIRIKQLRVEDSHSYLCLAEFRNMKHDYSSDREHITPPFIHVFQSEIRLQVRPANSNSNSLIYVLVVLVLLLPVCVLLAVSWKKKVHIWLMGFIRGTKRNVPPSTRSEQEQKPPQSEQSDSFTYANISTGLGKARKPQTEDQEQPDSCTYATILMRGEKGSKPQAEDQGGQKQEAGPPEVIYAAVVKKQ
ncbi:uncharacterized protein LOC132396475 [Hypanus sabinus]|uniref:uncharacterized protein LOC132396475 n=1 Tax=Hypanus sabinus TaxID=79690 RepID=UPI0028C3B9DB|nr:uncharacterized protein LOC132396475 [Hypanus sabinus]